MDMADGTQLIEAIHGVSHRPSRAVPCIRHPGCLESIPLPARCHRLSRLVSWARRGSQGCIFRFGR